MIITINDSRLDYPLSIDTQNKEVIWVVKLLEEKGLIEKVGVDKLKLPPL